MYTKGLCTVEGILSLYRKYDSPELIKYNIQYTWLNKSKMDICIWNILGTVFVEIIHILRIILSFAINIKT